MLLGYLQKNAAYIEYAERRHEKTCRRAALHKPPVFLPTPRRFYRRRFAVRSVLYLADVAAIMEHAV